MLAGHDFDLEDMKRERVTVYWEFRAKTLVFLLEEEVFMKSSWITSTTLGCLISATLILSPEMARSVDPPKWSGRWTCNLDGRPAVLELTGNIDPNWCWLDKEACEFLCTLIGSDTVAGRLSDNGWPWQTIYTRPFYPESSEKPEYEHVIPLELNNEPWLLLMHTWNKNYMSGYTTWHGRAFGIQCNR